VENGIVSGLDWFPTLVAAAGNPNIVEELKRGKKLGDATYKVHLDGYNQMDLFTGKGPSKRNEVYYFAEGTTGRGANRRLQVPVHRSTRRLARRYGKDGRADSDQPPSRPA
jgi:arylsulfatase A-like enzyme